MSLVLHYHPLSSYCWKVMIGLYEAEVPFEERMVNLGDPEATSAFAKLWPTAKIPLLEDTARGQVVPETSIMLEYVEQHYPGARSMFPKDPETLLEARLWDRVFDLYVNSPLGQIVRHHYGQNPAAEAAVRADLRKAYPMIEARMTGRTWAVGDDFSIADCAAAPALFYATVKEPADDFPALNAYRQRLLERPSVARAVEGARSWFQYYPFKDSLPAEYRPAA